MIAGLETITEGTITIGDADVTHLELVIAELLWSSKRMLYPHMTVWKILNLD